MCHDDHLEPLIAADRLVGTHLIQALAVGAPAPLPQLEERRRHPLPLHQVERPRVEMDADQGEQAARLPVARPQDLVVPVSRFPPFAFDGISVVSSQRRLRWRIFPAGRSSL